MSLKIEFIDSEESLIYSLENIGARIIPAVPAKKQFRYSYYRGSTSGSLHI